MNDLIINGIDHSVFDLDWAKRGGVVMLEEHMAKVTYVCNISGSVYVAQTLGQKAFNGESFTNVSPQLLRMATPDECHKAWIEYIEPMQAEIDSLEAQLEEARKDSERLDWVVGSCNDYGFDIGVNHTVISRLYWIDGIDEIARGKTPREAIDNAIKGGE